MFDEAKSAERWPVRRPRRAGLELRELIPITRYFPSPGGSNEHVHLFCALVDSRGVSGIHGLAEEGEDIRVRVLSLAEARQALSDGVSTTRRASLPCSGCCSTASTCANRRGRDR